MANIVINPSKSISERIFNEGNLLHENELNQVVSIINKRLDSEEKENIYDTITILGSRGSGKTSFLLTLLDKYRKSENIFVLDLIDPTKTEEKGHVFLTILSLLNKEINEKCNNSCFDPCSQIYKYREQWRNIMKNMAAGLPYLDGIGSGCQEWQDEEFIMDNGLKCVSSAMELKNSFSNLIDIALTVLEKKAILIAFDDIDVDFRKGWLVMETLRKYLCVPHIITIVSGDIQLLTKGIRKQQWKSFGKALLINEGERLNRMNEFDDMVSEMESQYLQKVLPTQNWITLSTIAEMALQNKLKLDDIIIDFDNQNKAMSLVAYYITKLKDAGIVNGYQVIAYINFLLTLPIRMQLQIIVAFNEEDNWKMLNPFVSSLLVKRVDVDLLKSNEWRVVKSSLELLINEKCLDDAYQMLPSTSDSKINDCLFALGSMFSFYVHNNPHLIFDYMLNIGQVRNLLTIMPLYNDSNASVAGLCEFAGIGLDNVYRNISCKKESYIRAALNSNQKTKNYDKNWGGTIVLPGLAARRKQSESLMSDRIDVVFKNKTFEQQCLAYMPLMLAQFGRKQQTLTLYSIDILLASIGELLRFSYNESELLPHILSNFSQIRSFVMPGFGDGNEQDNADKYEYDEDNEAVNCNNIKSFVASIVKWSKSAKGNTIAPYLLGKISTRIFYAFRYIDDQKFDNLAEAMHRRIIIVLNSILIEETKEKMADILINNNNPRKSDKLFINNIKAVTTAHQRRIDLPLTKMFMSCPLLTAYLNMNSDLERIYLPFIDKQAYTDINIYEELKHVKLGNN